MHGFRKCSVLVVEDHPLYLEGLRSMLTIHAPEIRCLTAVSFDAAIRVVDSNPGIDLLISDYFLPGERNGVELLQSVRGKYPEIALALMSGGNDHRLNSLAKSVGCVGYLSKSLEPGAWIDALRIIFRGGSHFLGEMNVSNRMLTERQLSVLELAAAGLGNREIASQLGLTERNVKYHLGEACARLDTSSRTEAVARATALGLINGIPSYAKAIGT